MGISESSCGRENCCRTRACRETEWNGEREAASDKPTSKVRIRTTITEHDIGLSLDDVEARQGVADPDLDALREQIAASKVARDTEESAGDPEGDLDVSPKKRSKGRRGTAAPEAGLADTKGKVGVKLDVGDSPPEAELAGPGQARLSQRKATGALVGGLNQFYEPEDEEWEEGGLSSEGKH